MMVRFDFAYNNALFADRILHLEVVPSPTDEAQAMVDGSCGRVVEKLHVSSMLLAAHSDYFMKLYSNGMSESSTGVATVKVTEEERRGLLHLIQYMYTGRLMEPPDADSTIILLTLADRFAISSCMKPLADVLNKFPSSLSDCLLILGLPESLKSDKALHPVVEQCRSYLAQQFQSIPAKKSQFFALNMEGVKIVLDSDTLAVSYEEEVFHFLLEWLEANFRSLDDKLHAAEQIGGVIRFPWMTGDFLVDVVAVCPEMQSSTGQGLIMEALKFKSLTHPRQQEIIWKKTNHNRYRPRNNAIFENFWGSSKTFVSKETAVSCQVYFEFPLEMVICTGESFHSKPFFLDRYTFSLEAQIRTAFNHQRSCSIKLALHPSSETPALDVEATTLHSLDYTIAMKRDYSQGYDTKASGTLEIQAGNAPGNCVTFTDLFSGWYVERGYSFPRWNLTINGLVFLRLDLKLNQQQLIPQDVEADGETS
ncbi:BTB/POZ domain-containing protein At2g46260-like [Selaginella moellendorffii]|uniref:BTB/POZ domain-containing protein At2g46260-like n=1 Tax=Selaginella moellendorffii TaxID=88036 RepID=UPI000D1CEE6F|nr:BTB/POZ domain-containing protein At2g46260-like [Selaginella moellendorffii]|eukprot:XP_024522144.1 BTB/POZ domain-containing protein At2g46260-like [Selaginella moellendorffii]